MTFYFDLGTNNRTITKGNARFSRRLSPNIMSCDQEIVFEVIEEAEINSFIQTEIYVTRLPKNPQLQFKLRELLPKHRGMS